MTQKDRQEVAFILGQILGILNQIPVDRNTDEKIDALTETIAAFTLKGVKKEK